MAQGQGSRVGGRSSADEPYIVVSTDSHVGPSCKDQLRDYCESKYLGDFDRFVTEMEGHGLLSFRSSEARTGGEENISFGRAQAERFAEQAGIRNADQVDLRFLQRSYEAS